MLYCREHDVLCKFIDNSVIDDYLVAVTEIVGPDNIIAASKCDRQAKVFLKSEDSLGVELGNFGT
jgi:hypothetical protein